MKKHLIFLALLLFAIEIHAQKISWNDQPEKGLVYSITNREARKIFRSGYSFVPDKMLHTCVDSFNTRIGWINRPPAGHFVLVSVRQNRLTTEFVSCIPYQVFLLKEYNAVSVQVLDSAGKVRTDARVKLGMNLISADTATKTYRITDPVFTGKEDLLSVKLDGFTSFYHIAKHEVPPVWNNYNDNPDRPRFYSYLVTDKNRYKPGDKVRFKSYTLNSFRNPVKKPLLIRLYAYPKTVNLGKIKPHRPGSFWGEFILHDSLGLKLDNFYSLQLVAENGQIVSECNFRFEDYELKGNRLDIDLEKKQFYPGKNVLTITATDVNGLTLKDARAEIVVLSMDLKESFAPVSVLNDTLLKLNTVLSPSAPTTVDINPGLFGQTNTDYEVRVTILTSENERAMFSRKATFYYSAYELSTRFSNDSLCFDLLQNDRPLQNIPVSLQQNGEAQVRQIRLPYKVKINPAITFYHFTNEYIDKIIEPRLLSPRVEFTGGFEGDSIRLKLDNPHKLHVSWYIYRGTELLEKGSGVETEFKSKITDRSDNYYAELLYSLGGEDFSKKKQFEFRDSKLNVTLNLPERVYPGQKTDATIRVTDQRGEPVKDVDLTAIAANRKLNYTYTELPYYGNVSNPRPQATSYSMEESGKNHSDRMFNYSKWVSTFRLDTMLYYRFLYPDSSFRYTIDSPDSTQFQVFVMRNGFSLPVYVIELDHAPVYFSWTNQAKQYSFYANPGRKHQVSLRLREQVIIIDSLRFEKGKKTIISLNMDHLPAGTKVLPVKKEFSAFERRRYEPFIAHFRSSAGKYAFLEFNDEFFPLYDIKKGNGFITAGPVYGGRATYSEKNGPHINFRYEGGYTYQFEDNAVYKISECGNTGSDLPKCLHFFRSDAVSELNDRMYTKQSFISQQIQTLPPVKKWISRNIDIRDVTSRLKISLPYDTAGITGILFINTVSGKITSPYFDLRSQNHAGQGIPKGLHSVVVLYEDGNYLRQDSISFNYNTQTCINFNHSSWHLYDSASLYWLTHFAWRTDYQSFYESKPEKPRLEFTYRNTFNGNVQGIIYDETTNEPLPGVSILIKGTTDGAITDIDGHFSLDIEDYEATLQISFIGYVTETIQVSRGTEVIMKLKPDVCALQEVVVVGYGVQRKREVTGAISIISPGNIPIDKIEDLNLSQNDKESEKKLYNELLNLNSIRNNFSDVAIWEPGLFTDKNGESKFPVTFPDDITRWDAIVYAMNSRLQTGTERKSIRSFKPLMAELHTPQFLTAGDTAIFIGKTLNYTSDTLIEGKIKIQSGDIDEFKMVRFGQYRTDLIPVTPLSPDSMTVLYTFTRNDGYFDGEERKVPVIMQGADHEEGSLTILKNGDRQAVKAAEGETRIVEITDNQLEIYKAEVLTLFNYRYYCNEQLASRLVGLINLKYFNRFEEKKFRHDDEIRLIINRLLRNQNSQFLWSWWDISENSSYWISAHILRALKFASDAGYPVNLNVQNLAEKASFKFDFLKDISSGDIDLLHALATWKAPLNYRKYITVMDSLIGKQEVKYSMIYNGRGIGYSMLHEKLLLEEIRQMVIPGYKPDILRYKKQGILGEVYFSDGRPAYNWMNSELETNLDAYRIIRNDSAYRNLISPMQQYFISARKNSWNTYESSNLLLTVLPDLLAEGYSKDRVAQITVTGKENSIVTKFPYRAELKSGEELQIKKEKGLPLYCMNYTVQRVTEARTGVEGLTINTYFDDNKYRLEAGKPVELFVEVVVMKDAPVEHVMIEVPVPAGCSYESKDQPYNSQETHREYFKEKTVIFCESLSPGMHAYTIRLLPKYTGSYFVNPAKVSLMYVPVVNANTDMKKAVIY
ncbi:MAG TPA: carboxypeptidase-like regulatory domain-containing protein [Bacteroidales bacterium]|nr:carboxypeptidase-like regulatory domain-containing protein [Bacteroidales bacterium]